MSHIISVAIQKGGVGKTTTVTTTAHALGELGKKVLVLDIDPQHNASMILGKVSPYEMSRTAIDLFSDDDAYFSSCSTPSKYKNVDLISSHIDMFAVSDQLAGPKQIVGLKNKLDAAAKEQYDFILIDCPPALSGPFVNNALVISDHYLFPIESESYFALKGVQQFLQTANMIKKTINPRLSLIGVLITMADQRTNVTKAMIEAIHNFFGKENVFKTIISRNTAVNTAAMNRKTIIEYDGRQQGAKDYRAFAQELVEWVSRNSSHKLNT